MCGIAGTWGQTDEALVREMMHRLVHRGPDAKGLHVDPAGPGVLGHQRLSIMDPAGGDQPIQNEAGQLTIVGNGEFYNFPQLRKHLARNHRFTTRSDTEAALHLYEDVGRTLAGRLDGMFALAIADGEDLYLARDPIGIKPLSVGERGDALVFASELKALAGRADRVREFPPGTWYHSAVGYRRYFEVSRKRPQRRPLQEHLRRLRQTLESCVVKRLMSDVPVGAFLSGGLDSSLIAAIARQHVDELHTFAVGLEGSRDLAAARLVARHLDTVHHEYVFTEDEMLEKLPEIIFHLESFDQDLVRSAIPCYFTSRLAARHVKVILTGEGADELFAGYKYYQGIRHPEVLHDELLRSVSAMHNINLQRVDRLTMAHSIEGRVPFLDVEMIDLAQTIPAAWKLKRHGGRPVEKWILRKAFEDLLPGEIVWRVKEQFDEGSGTADVMSTILAKWMTAKEAERYQAQHSTARLRSAEEAVYHRLLLEAFPKPDVVLANIGRWADRPRPTADKGTARSASGKSNRLAPPQWKNQSCAED
jgi:asparagine synthase (glutamine-hydrolysing)